MKLRMLLPLLATLLIASHAQAGNVVIFGDSISVGASADTGAQAYAARLAGKITTADYLLNYSRGGWAVLGDVGIVDPASVSGLLQMWPHTVIIALGTNDFSVEVPVDDFAVAYASMLARLRAWNASMKLVCVTPFPRIDEAANADGVPLAAYRSAIETACWNAGGYALDGKSAIPEPITDYLVDGLHPNNAGHRKIANWLWPQLKSILNGG